MRIDRRKIQRTEPGPRAMGGQNLKASPIDIRTLAAQLFKDRPQGCNPNYQSKFPPFNFQREAIQEIEKGNSVLVSAPTGSGKTLIATSGIWHAVSKRKLGDQGPSIIYTAPLKALSSQKIEEFKEDLARMLLIRAGEDPANPNPEKLDLAKKIADQHVGIQTGDISENTDAPIQIMTTEVLNQILLGSGIETLKNLRTVIYDELHYIDDPDRGTVWEESLIKLPNRNKSGAPIQIVGLSATMKNAKEICDWLQIIKGKSKAKDGNAIKLIEEPEANRPVPLNYYFFNSDCLSLKKAELVPVKNHSSQKAALEFSDKQQKLKDPNVEDERLGSFLFQSEILTRLMHENDMLPAIVFVFNRRYCDKAAKHIASINENLSLVTDDEKQELNRIIDKVLANKDNESLKIEEEYIDLLRKGIACHHADHLPKYKALVEKLFEKGLIKIVFATSTLSAGINMPAKTTVITSTERKDEFGDVKPITTSLFKQMAGRAGRLGIEKQGNVIVFAPHGNQQGTKTRFIEAETEELKGRFAPSYSSILTSLQDSKFSEKPFEKLLLTSFLAYKTFTSLDESNNALAALKEQYLSLLNNILAGRDGLEADIDDLFQETLKLKSNPELDSLIEKFELYNELKSILISSGFLTKEGLLTEKGKVASNFKFNNPLFITDFLYNLCHRKDLKLNELNAEEFAEFIAVLAETKNGFHPEIYKERVIDQIVNNKKLLQINETLLKMIRDFQAQRISQSAEQASKVSINPYNFQLIKLWMRKVGFEKLAGSAPAKVLKSLRTTLNLLKHIERAARVHGADGKAILGEDILKLAQKAKVAIDRDIVSERSFELAL